VALFWLLRFWGDPVRFGTCLQRVKRLLISAR
jgi:hypothetical protein